MYINLNFTSIYKLNYRMLKYYTMDRIVKKLSCLIRCRSYRGQWYSYLLNYVRFFCYYCNFFFKQLIFHFRSKFKPLFQKCTFLYECVNRTYFISKSYVNQDPIFHLAWSSRISVVSMVSLKKVDTKDWHSSCHFV